VGIESLALLRDSTLPNARAQLPALTAAVARVRTVPGVQDVRQCGFMVGIELASQPGRALGAEVCSRARAHGVILRPLGDVIVWMPPLSLQAGDLALLERATAASIREVLA
jgi:adenosylmethionine-8-amino-7-oxononanoate aminotransferase